MRASYTIAAAGLALAVCRPESAFGQGNEARIDADTMQALDRMGEALRRHMDIAVHTDLTVEDVTAGGQKLQYGGTVDIVAHRPDKLRMDMRIANGARQLFYDGSRLTFYSPNQGVYATAPAPANIREMLVAAREQVGLEIPLADLFLWGDDPALASRVESAFRVGTATVGDHLCDHFAVRQRSVDWQIWMRAGSEPLPCKLVITDRTDPAMPQVIATYRWLPVTPVPASTYRFTPAEGDVPIVFGAMRAPARKEGN